MTRRAALLSLAGPLLLRADAQQQGRKIVDDALAALGGDAYLAMRDRMESGRVYSFYRERMSGLSRATIYTRYTEAREPGALALRERQSYHGKDRKKEDYAVLFNELGGFQVTSRGARPVADELWARYQDTTLRNIFYILRQRMKEPGMIFERRETAVLENQPVEVVDITDAENRVVTVYFHQTTRLPVRQVFQRRDETRYRHEETTILAKYRDIGGGVKWPYNIVRNRDGEKVFEIFSEEVTVGGPAEDRLFELPSGLPMLKRV